MLLHAAGDAEKGPFRKRVVHDLEKHQGHEHRPQLRAQLRRRLALRLAVQLEQPLGPAGLARDAHPEQLKRRLRDALHRLHETEHDGKLVCVALVPEFCTRRPHARQPRCREQRLEEPRGGVVRVVAVLSGWLRRALAFARRRAEEARERQRGPRARPQRGDVLRVDESGVRGQEEVVPRGLGGLRCVFAGLFGAAKSQASRTLDLRWTLKF